MMMEDPWRPPSNRTITKEGGDAAVEASMQALDSMKSMAAVGAEVAIRTSSTPTEMGRGTIGAVAMAMAMAMSIMATQSTTTEEMVLNVPMRETTMMRWAMKMTTTIKMERVGTMMGMALSKKTQGQLLSL